MPEHPLLLFPTPENADRTKHHPPFGRVHKPDIERQIERLSPMFDQLQLAFIARRVDIQQTTHGIDPEQVLVIETVGSIDNFTNAVKRIEGFEWMGELELDEITPDEDFYDESHPQKELNGRLYFIMTNQQALDEMVSLWRHYQDDPFMKFDHGLTKFRDVFLHLKNIRRWDVQDRLLETGLIEIWLESLEYDGERVVQFEAELWYRGSAESQQSSTNRVTDLVQNFGGSILGQSIIEGIAYHGLLAELPANAIRYIVENYNNELTICDNVMFFRPVGQMVVGDTLQEGEVETAAIGDMPNPEGDPVIALLDGVPLQPPTFVWANSDR